MPGSNNYSMDPALLVENETSKASPTLVGKTNSNTSAAPEAYKMRDFDMNAWVASTLKDKFGGTSNRDFRKLNRYLSSKEGIAALLEARDKHRKTEEFKRWSALLQLQKFLVKDKNEKSSKSNTNPVIKASKQPITPAWTARNADVNKISDTYTVEAGNTLGQIVSAYNKKNNTNLKLQDVAKWSGIEDADKIKIGNVIRFTNPEASKTTPADVKSNTPAAQTVVTPAPATSSEGADSVKVQSMPNINSSDSVRVDSALRNEPDSTLVLPVDTGNVVRADSALRSSLDSLILNSASNDSTLVLPADTARADSALRSYPRNFTWTGLYFNYPTEEFMRDMKLYRDHLKAIVPEKNISNNKQGGTMNRINYFQQGGATPAAQTGQADAFMQAILQGDPEAIQQLVQLANDGNEQATQIVLTILDADEKGNKNVAKAAQVIKQILGQATSAKWGSKLQYIRSLKYAKGGKTCPECESKKVELKACGGKNKKKKYFGGGPFEEIEHGNIKVQTPTKYLGNESYGEKPKRVILKHNVASMPNDTLYFDNSRQLQEVLGSNSVKEGLHSEKTKDMYGTVDRWGNRNNSKAEIRFNQYLR